MAVNPLQPTIPFTLTPSIQNAERSQQRKEEKEKKEDSFLKSKITPTKSNLESAETIVALPLEKQALELTGQIIDSQTVIELLAHRPKLKRSARNCFNTQSELKKNSQFPDVKKFNKAF
ncbi:MAG: hypothetical protein HQ462_10550 [Deltaproteobacteria bacterium]|nr:hypothetical protein [Deltaproteobacteria bacterium]